MTEHHCEQCGGLDGRIQQVSISWPTGENFEGRVHPECENDLIKRLERERVRP
jgi:hypothetical protein